MNKNLKIILLVLITLLSGAFIIYFLSRPQAPASPPVTDSSLVDPLSVRESLTPEQITAKEKALNDPELKRKESLTPAQIKAKQLLLQAN